MHLRQVKGYMHLCVIFETDKLQLYFLIIQKSEFILPHFYPLADAGIFIQVVVLTKVTLVQYLVHHFTAFAAKFFFFQQNLVGWTSFAAMVTLYFFIYKLRCRHTFPSIRR